MDMPIGGQTPASSSGRTKKIITIIVVVLVVAGLGLAIANFISSKFDKKTGDDFNAEGLGTDTTAPTDTVAPASPYANWYAFSTDAFALDTPNDEKFAIFFPAFPDRSKDNLDTTNAEREFDYYTYSARDKKNSFFGVNVTYLSKSLVMSDPQVSLQGALDGLIKSNKENVLYYSKKTIFQGFQALDYVLGNASLDLSMKGRMIAVPARNVTYHLLYVYTGENGSEEDYAKFVDSLQIDN